jgi:hypothetical protein
VLTFDRFWQDKRDRVAVEIDTLIVAGWAGRDMHAIEHHIEELAAIGVPRPSAVPLFYRIGTGQLTQTTHLQVLGPDTSGEVEPVIVSMADGLWVAMGSDHTDRKAEAAGVALSKQLCSKVVGTGLWRYDEVQPHWDQLILRSWATIDGKRVLYQEGAVSSLRSPDDLMTRYRNEASLPHARRHWRHPSGQPLRDGAGRSGSGPQADARLRHRGLAGCGLSRLGLWKRYERLSANPLLRRYRFQHRIR